MLPIRSDRNVKKIIHNHNDSLLNKELKKIDLSDLEKMDLGYMEKFKKD